MLTKLKQVLSRYWGFSGFMPLQQEAMAGLCAGRDGVVVLPTGGGKSLCYQGPALVLEGLAVVVSPLISLMKDQVDDLKECGVQAERIDSSLSSVEQQAVKDRIRQGQLKLLYLSPERLLGDGFVNFLKQTPISFIAVDEAHCVSMWGHDFRPEYRQLGQLREIFPQVTLAAYTATATAQVRDDIVAQLRLKNPQVLVGSFDRPNLIYKVQPRMEIGRQVRAILERHKGASGIIYCIRRKDVDQLCVHLQSLGYRAAPYHAGLDDEVRKGNQDRFIRDEVDTIVATIAFGMGIDKPNVRYVIHAGMPKSLEHYQQESGRAGRDGLEAECTLFHGGEDYATWKFLMKEMPPEALQVASAKLNSMYRFCHSGCCRHGAILKYFGEAYEKENCQACDFCLGDVELVADALVTGQKILSCVLRLEQRFGSAYTAAVLAGGREKRILDLGHDKLSTYGLLRDFRTGVIQDWIEQLISQGYAEKTGEYNVLQVTPRGRLLLKGQEKPRLLKPAENLTRKAKAKAAADSWEGVDSGLFEALRQLRAGLAHAKNLPPYMVFGDGALRAMARYRPSGVEGFLQISGVGQQKNQLYGEQFRAAIREYCTLHKLPQDVPQAEIALPDSPRMGGKANLTRERAWKLFEQQRTVEEVAAALGRAQSTISDYLAEYVAEKKLADPAPWVDAATFTRVAEAAEKVGTERLRPIYDHLEESVNFYQIRICLSCLRQGK